MMTKCERAILFFLVQDSLAENSDWAYSPTRGEKRQLLDRLISELRLEDEENEKEKT